MMDTTNRDAASWIAGYIDYLRDLVGAADTTQLHYLRIPPAATAWRRATRLLK
jgi:hypothetical protein